MYYFGRLSFADFYRTMKTICLWYESCWSHI